MRNLTILFLLIPFFVWSQTMLIDGKFDDWDAIDPIFEDPANDVTNYDFTKLWVTSDEQFIYLSLQLNTEFNLQENNNLALYMDLDNNVNTGATNQNYRGSDLIFNFGAKIGSLYIDGRVYNITHIDIGLFTAPTVSSDRFEMAFRRDDNFYNEPIFTSPKVQLFIRDQNFGDRIPDANTIAYDLNDQPVSGLPPYSIKKVGDSDIRVLSFNLQRDGILDPGRFGAYKRLIQAVEPDIIAFQEVYDVNESRMRTLMDDIMPTAPTGETWDISKVQPDIIMVSKFKLKGQETLMGGSSGSAGNGVFVYEMPEYGTDLVFINCHLPCCQNNENRQAEVDAVMKFVKDYKNGNSNFETKENAPIIIAGDMNLVGFDEQLNTFITGDIQNENVYGSDFAPDWDGTDFDDALPYTTDYPTAFTWYSRGSDFSPGRLDFIIYSGASLDLKNSYTLFTTEMSTDTLSAYGLNANDIVGASDHLPIVADFKVKEVSSINHISSSIESFELSPNPFSNNFNVKFDLKKQQEAELAVYNYTGQLVQVLKKQQFPIGENQFSFSGKGWPSGLYFLSLKTEEGVVSLKMIKH